MGLSFAIPIDVAMEVVEQLKESGSVSRGWLGVLIRRVDRDLAEAFQMERAAGALVTQVFADSPAEAGGIREGDVIVEFAGKQIDLSSELPHIVGRTRPDEKVDVTVVRNGKRMNLAVTIGKLDQEEVRGMRPAGSTAAPDNRIGLQVRDLRPDERERLGVERGVVVTQVTADPAASAGIRDGDVITSINNEWIDSTEQFERLVADLEAGVAIPIRVVRGRTPDFIVIKIPE